MAWAQVIAQVELFNANPIGETIRIQSDTVNRITRVRYNWNKRPNQELVNEAGLPAVPFHRVRIYDDLIAVAGGQIFGQEALQHQLADPVGRVVSVDRHRQPLQ